MRREKTRRGRCLMMLVMAVAVVMGAAYMAKQEPGGVKQRPPVAIADTVTPEPTAARTWPFQRVDAREEREKGSSLRNVMELYAYAGPIDPATLRSFCLARRDAADFTGSFYVVIFDDAANTKFPSAPFGAEYDLDPDLLKHIRAIYRFVRHNGYSEVRYHEKNIFDQIPKREKL